MECGTNWCAEDSKVNSVEVEPAPNSTDYVSPEVQVDSADQSLKVEDVMASEDNARNLPGEVEDEEVDDEVDEILIEESKPDDAKKEGKEEVVVKRQKASFGQLFSQVSPDEILILVVGVAGAMTHGLGQPVLCLFFGDLVDTMGGTAPVDIMDLASDLCLKMTVVGIVVTIGASFQGAMFKIFSEKQSMKWRMKYFDVVLHRDIEWYDTRDIAALPSEINDDLEKITDAFGDKFGNGVMSLSAFLGGFGCAFGLGWLIALVMTSILPLISVGAVVMGKAVQEVQLESQSWYAKAAAVVEECLYAMRTVVAFGGEKRELARFGEAVEQTRKGGVRNGLKIGAGMGYTMAVVFCGYALAFYFGMTLRYNDELNPATGELWNPGRILSIFFCVFIGSFMIGNIDPSAKAFESARFGAGRFFAVLEHKAHIQAGSRRWPPSPRTARPSTPPSSSSPPPTSPTSRCARTAPRAPRCSTLSSSSSR